jgi:hypothetical protein
MEYLSGANGVFSFLAWSSAQKLIANNQALKARFIFLRNTSASLP